MSNKRLGNTFERELADVLYKAGFWTHILSPNQAGQPADIISVRHGAAYLIDCKVCSTGKGFSLSRMEENQDLAMEFWRECGNGEAWFAIKCPDGIFMIPHVVVKTLRKSQAVMTPTDIKLRGEGIEQWMRCK